MPDGQHDDGDAYEHTPQAPPCPGGGASWHVSLGALWHRLRRRGGPHERANGALASGRRLGLRGDPGHLCLGDALRGAPQSGGVARLCPAPTRRLSVRSAVPYTVAQLVGAVLGSATVAALFWPFFLRFEATKGLIRGAPGSELSAMVFGEYFPNPAMFGTGEAAQALVTPWQAACVEGFGTGVLVLVIFALTDPRNRAAPTANLGPFFIGFTVAVLISLFAPITQAGWNPAREFGPRLVAYTLGWGAIAIPGPAAGFWVYIVGPLVGGPLGGLAWRLIGGEGGPSARIAAEAVSSDGSQARLAPASRNPMAEP